MDAYSPGTEAMGIDVRETGPDKGNCAERSGGEDEGECASAGLNRAHHTVTDTEDI